MALSKYEREVLQEKHRLSMEPHNAKRRAEAEAHQAQIAAAQENLRRAIRADSDRGLDKSAALRHVKPIRPAVLDEKISALAPQADKDRLAKIQADALREYRHHLLLADPALLDRSQLAELATAARIAATDPETIQE